MCVCTCAYKQVCVCMRLFVLGETDARENKTHKQTKKQTQPNKLCQSRRSQMLVNFCFLQASPFSSLLMAARLQLHLQSTCTYVCVMYLCACCQPDFHMQLQLELLYFAIRSLTHTDHVVAHTTTPTLRFSTFPCGAGVQGSFRSFVWLFPMSSFL